MYLINSLTLYLVTNIPEFMVDKLNPRDRPEVV